VTETRRRSREGWIWGSLLAVSLFAGVIAFAQWVERGDAAPEPAALALDQEAGGARYHWSRPCRLGDVRRRLAA
jgi:hypothetical protein